MTHSQKIIGFLFVVMAGVWGCSKVSTGEAKNPSVEAKAQRLEEDFRAAAAARDQFRQKLLATEERLSALENRSTQLQTLLDETRNTLTAERDSLRAELKARTTERDNMAAQYDGFRKNLKTLLGDAENALAKPATPAVQVGAQPVAVPVAAGSALRN